MCTFEADSENGPDQVPDQIMAQIVPRSLSRCVISDLSLLVHDTHGISFEMVFLGHRICSVLECRGLRFPGIRADTTGSILRVESKVVA